MNTTSAVATLAPTNSSRGARARRMLLAGLAAGALAVSTLVAAQPANAWVLNNGAGSYNVTLVAPMYVNSAGSLNPTYRQLTAPAVTVAATARAGSGQWQTVSAAFTLQRWNGSAWTNYDVKRASATLMPGQTTTLRGESYGRWTRGYYYRTVIDVAYTTHTTVYVGARDPLTGALIGTVTSTTTGRVGLLSDRTSDHICTVSPCQSSPGFVWVG